MKLYSHIKKILCILAAIGLLAGCSQNAGREETSSSPDEASAPQAASIQIRLHTEETSPESPSSLASSSSDIDLLLQEMTLRQKVGQLFIVRPDSLDGAGQPTTDNPFNISGVTALTDAMLDALKTYPVGGIVMFSQNIHSPKQLTAFNEALQAAASIPMFLAVDEEGGRVARLANHIAFNLPKYKSAGSVGASGDASKALSMGTTIGGYLKSYGFNMDFAPVADVNTNPKNPVIGTRAFSSDAAVAAQMAGAMAEGLRQQGIIPVFKHFPGHGDTAEDSHKGIAVSSKTEEEMWECEWLPFYEAGSLDCVMAGHIAVPAIDNDLTPATMSPRMITEILKGELGFEGLVITDSLEMEAVTDDYSPGEAALSALKAGCDLLLMPTDLAEAFDAVCEAVRKGDISEESLDDRVRRILQLKQAYGIWRS